MNKRIFIIIVIVPALIFVQCGDSIVGPPDIPAQILMSAPDTLSIQNQKLVSSTYMWRDFQPISPPNGKPLIAMVYIQTADSSVISSSINADAVYIIHNNQVWRSFLKDGLDHLYGLKKFRIVKRADNGPKWEPASWLM